MERGYPPVTVDEYLAAVPEDQRSALEKIRRVILDGIRSRADIREAVATLIVKQDRKVARQADHHIPPDAKIGAERVREYDDRLIGRASDHLVVNRNPVHTCKLHVNLSFYELGILSRLGKMIFPACLISNRLLIA